MSTIIRIENLSKIYDGGFQALKGVNLEISEGEILALLGPNGAGKTTLISTVCGITDADRRTGHRGWPRRHQGLPQGATA